MLKMSVTCRALLTFLALQLSPLAAKGEPNEILKPAGTIALGRLEGYIPSIVADADGGRLYVAERVYPTAIVAIDAKSGKEVGRTSKPIGMGHGGAAFIADLNRLVNANGLGIDIYQGSNLTPVGTVRKMGDVGCIRYDPVSKLVYVGHDNPSCSIAAFDPKTLQKVSDIQLDGLRYPEGFQLETKGDRMFVNNPAMQQIAVIDRRKRAVVGIWPLQDPRWNLPWNYPMALDEEHHRLIAGCRNPAKLFVIDTDTGKIVSTVDCCPQVCDVYYDAQRKRIYASGDEYVSVIRQADPNTYKIVGFITTNSRANTSLFVPATRKFYVAVQEPRDPETSLMVFDCGTDAAPTTAPAAAAGTN